MDGTPSKSERTRQRILDAAAAQFSSDGYNARLSDIADAAGIQTGSLYYHFDSRDDLVAEVLLLGIETSWRHVREAVAALPDGSTARDALAAAIRAHTLSVLEIGDYSSAQARIVGQVPAAVRERHMIDQRRYGEYWNGLIEAAVASGELRDDLDPFVTRMLVLGALNWTAEWYQSGRSTTAPDVADQAVTIALDGLTRRP